GSARNAGNSVKGNVGLAKNAGDSLPSDVCCCCTNDGAAGGSNRAKNTSNHQKAPGKNSGNPKTPGAQVGRNLLANNKSNAKPGGAAKRMTPGVGAAKTAGLTSGGAAVNHGLVKNAHGIQGRPQQAAMPKMPNALVTNKGPVASNVGRMPVANNQVHAKAPL